jgi:hypothetical protein
MAEADSAVKSSFDTARAISSSCSCGVLRLPLTAILLCSIVKRALYRVQDLYRKTPSACQGDADTVRRAIQGDLLDNPRRGTIVPGLAGIRKARAENPARGKGKRGGFRYMYYFLERDDEIYLLFLFDKGEQEDLNERQKTALRTVVAELKGS